MSSAIAAAPSHSRSRCWSRNAGCPSWTRRPSHTPSPRTKPASNTETTARSRGTSTPFTCTSTEALRGSSAKSWAPWAVAVTGRRRASGEVAVLGRPCGRRHLVRIVDVRGAQPRERRVHLVLGLGAADPVGALDGLARLELLVDGEEVLDLQPVELRQVVDVAHVLEPRVGGGHAEHLVVATGLVGHPVHPDRPALDQAAGEGGLTDQQHQGIERVAVEAEGVLDEAVVGGILRRREQGPVEPDPAALVVDLVLVAAPLRDLHEYVEVHRDAPPGPAVAGDAASLAQNEPACPAGA